MSTSVHTYETDNATWREEFEKAYVEWVDLELIKTLLESIDCSVRFLCDSINDTTRWPSKINKTLRTVSYPRVRDTADFLGIPPWLLFNHQEKNSKIKGLFSRINSILTPIDLPYFSEYENLYDDFNYELSKRIPEKEFDILTGMLKNILGYKHYHEVIAGNWKSVVSYFNDIHQDFSGGARFSYRDPDAILKGSLRINFTTSPRNKRVLMKAGWLSIETDTTKPEHSLTINRLLTTIINDMEWIFDQQPWIFEIASEGKKINLLTWHNLRTSNDYYEKIADIIHRKLPDANFSMNIGERHGVSSYLFSQNDPFNEFIQIIKSDVKHLRKQKTRKTNTLQLLYEKGVIQYGDKIILLPTNKTKGLLLDEKMSIAWIIIINNKPAVRWEYDNNVYSISRLTEIIFVEIAQQVHLLKHHLNGSKYWGLSVHGQSLFSLARQENNKEARQ
ncbi:hypothetical protein [Paenibacillus taiwanensis]|uniref:hypothetical protein n=1 Tax=Paenibacillus taiwanensis TaxID=401638 RepID=UPI000404F79C|nr:hypothetical protein [Paenibacillus taiwanensis]